jgi:hypothetical protein
MLTLVLVLLLLGCWRTPTQQLAEAQLLRHYNRELQDSDISCLSDLQDVAGDDNTVDMNEFMTYISRVSGGMMEVKKFSDLPLSLILIYHFVSCFGGRNCVRRGVPLDTTGQSGTALNILCSKVDSIVPDFVTLTFRYLIRYDSALTAEEVMAGVNGNRIIPNLEMVSEKILLQDLGCVASPTVVARSGLASLHRNGTVLHVMPYGNTSGQRDMNKTQFDNSGRFLAEVSVQGCRFSVDVVVDKIMDYGKSVGCPSGTRPLSTISFSFYLRWFQ